MAIANDVEDMAAAWRHHARSHQRAHELVDDLLRPRIAGRPFPSARFFHAHDADAYAATPGELAAAHAPAPAPGEVRPVWYFLSPAHYHGGDRRCRRVGCGAGAGLGGDGQWKAQCGRKLAEADGGGFLYVRNYVYVEHRVPEWVMIEYAVVGEDCRREEIVLCEMYRARKVRPH